MGDQAHRRPPEFPEVSRRGFVVGAASVVLAGCSAARPTGSTVIVGDTRERERKRLENLAWANRSIRRSMRVHQFAGYQPGQAVYNLGEYPATKPWEITDDDERRLDELAANGIELVQVHEEWNDAQRLFGGDKFTPVNERGFRRFIDACHRRKLKIIPYISSGYFEKRDPDFRPEWSRGTTLVELWYQYAQCSPASASWRGYLLPRVRRMLDEYGVDGLYNDVGYTPLVSNMEKATPDEVMAFEESAKRNGAFEDLLGVLYDEVKRRGGVVKVHAAPWYRRGGKPPTDRRLFDYLWVGETSDGLDVQREQLKDHPPYVVPCPYYARLEQVDAYEAYLHTLPYMQFPILMCGKPFTGERGFAPNVKYGKERAGAWTQLKHLAKVREHYQKDPASEHQCYGWWDSVTGGQERKLHYQMLAAYRAMTGPGSWAYVEVAESEIFTGDLPESVRASVYCNEDVHLILANYARQPAKVTLREAWRSGGGRVREVTLEPRRMVMLKRA